MFIGTSYLGHFVRLVIGRVLHEKIYLHQCHLCTVEKQGAPLYPVVRLMTRVPFLTHPSASTCWVLFGSQVPSHCQVYPCIP